MKKNAKKRVKRNTNKESHGNNAHLRYHVKIELSPATRCAVSTYTEQRGTMKTTEEKGNIVNQHEIKVFQSRAASSGSIPGFDMLPLVFLDRTAKRFDMGAKKYTKFNYRKGLRDKAFIIDRLNHAFLHLKLAIDAIEADTQTDDDNLSAVACNIAMAMEYEQANGLVK